MREVVEQIAVIGDNGKGVTIELNRVSFAGAPATLDLRRYVHGIPRKGVSLSDGEAVLLLMALRRLFEKGAAQDGKEPDSSQQ